MEKESKNEHINKDFEELKKKAEEYLNGWKRERADFLNYKKDEMERISQLVKYAHTEVILNVLPIIDTMYLAQKDLPAGRQEFPEYDKWAEGFLQIQNQIKDFLKQGGIEEIETIGKKFNPETMDAVEEIDMKVASGTVVEELQKGYMMQGKVLRPAKVKVSK